MLQGLPHEPLVAARRNPERRMEIPAAAGGKLTGRSGGADEPRLVDRQIFQQRQNADDDDDHADDLLCPPVNRQHIDQIKYENNDQERYEKTD
jgi:hypothetical protein